MSDTRQHVHELIDQLPPTQLTAVEGLLEAMLDRDEIDEQEEAAVARSKEWFKHNEGIPFEQVVAELGFTMDQIRNHRMDEEKDPAA